MAPVTVEPVAELLGSTSMPNSPAGSHRLPSGLGIINVYGKRGLNDGADLNVK